MVKVLRSFVRGPLEPYVVGFSEVLVRQGYTESSAGQHICFIAHLDRWMQAEGVGLESLSLIFNLSWPGWAGWCRSFGVSAG